MARDRWVRAIKVRFSQAMPTPDVPMGTGLSVEVVRTAYNDLRVLVPGLIGVYSIKNGKGTRTVCGAVAWFEACIDEHFDNDLVCPECGEPFATGQALGSHRARVHARRGGGRG